MSPDKKARLRAVAMITIAMTAILELVSSQLRATNVTAAVLAVAAVASEVWHLRRRRPSGRGAALLRLAAFMGLAAAGAVDALTRHLRAVEIVAMVGGMVGAFTEVVAYFRQRTKPNTDIPVRTEGPVGTS